MASHSRSDGGADHRFRALGTAPDFTRKEESMKLSTSALPLAIAAVILGVRAPLLAAPARPGHLVDVEWLAAHRADADVLILDASPGQAYAARHVPGALSVDLMSWYGVHARPFAEFERLYRSWGISKGKRIVMYDQGGTFLATRLFFSLYHHGFPEQDLLLLDGGLARWLERGLPVTTEPAPARAIGTFAIERPRDVQAELPEVLSASGDPAGSVLLEALGPDWHFGQVLAFDRAGHIPHGILLPSGDFYNADKTFKSAEEIGRMLTYLGVRPEQRIYTYCGGGVAASVPFFALRFLLGFPHVKLFTESEMGWLRDDRALPYWTYDAPFLMRDAQWLQAWTGPRLRAYAGTRVSIVDVRPAAAFGQGHVPFALNVPSEAFRSRVTRPATLADVLGRAGVDASHEAVIVSGGGLTPEAALAFAMLETLGQQRVSVLMDTMARWAERGLPVTAEPTAVGAPSGPRDLSIPPTVYPTHGGKDVIVTDPTRTPGVYPRVFVASGRTVPATAPAGTIRHVPSVDLLGADGTPKPASEIWSILTKAGVPRYAELVCFAEDPGEAAVTYFVLRLMGYPDVKVLVG
jgi:3-mercaptopyruvate sulfurtransferase SseA